MIPGLPKSFLLLLFALLSVMTSLNAQEIEDAPEKKEKVGKAVLFISGTMYFDGLRLEGVALTLEEEGQQVSNVFSDGNGKFKVEMKLDKIYSLIFTMDGYVDKSVDIDTRNVPTDNRKFNFTYAGWRVDMFPDDLDVDYSVLEKPVALVVYNPAGDEFTTDKKYEKSGRARREKLLKEVYAALDQKDIDAEGDFEDYMLAVKDGDLFLKEGDYESALMQYEAAKDIMPDETYPNKQITKTMALMQANQSVDEQYALHITEADEAFVERDWLIAKASYELANDVKPKMTYPKEQIEKIKENIKADELALMQLKEKERLAKYEAYVSTADSLKKLAIYPEAKSTYKQALAMYAKKEYPKTQISEIDALIAKNKNAEQAYADLLANANKFMNNREFEKAKTEYSNALGIKPNDELPKTKLKEIEVLLAGLAAIEAKEIEMEKKRKAMAQSRYDGFILSADALLVDKDYDKAKVDYESALNIMADQEYPKKQIQLINGKLAELEGVDKQYDKLMASGLKNQTSKKLEIAKSDYQAALELKPNEQAPKDAITKIDNQLAALAADVLAKQKAIDDKYNGFVADGDANMALEKYSDAKLNYEEALTVKSQEEYPKSQLAVINDKLKAIALLAAASEKEAKELADKELRYNQAITKADNYFSQNNLDDAKEEYQNALLVFEGKAYPISKIKEIDSKIAVLAAAKLAEEKEAAAIKAKENSYQELIKKADASLLAKDFVNAKLSYQNAQKVFTDRSYPATQIQKIDDLELAAQKKAEEEALLLANQIETKKKFDELLLAGDNLVSGGELQKAKYKYEAALKLIPGDAVAIGKMRNVSAQLEEERKMAEFHAKNDTEFNRELAEKYPNGLNETIEKGSKTTNRIVVVANGRGDEYKKETYSYGAVFYFKNGKKIDASTFKRETKGH